VIINSSIRDNIAIWFMNAPVHKIVHVNDLSAQVREFRFTGFMNRSEPTLMVTSDLKATEPKDLRLHHTPKLTTENGT
jgi:hypothetical protein